MNLVDPTGHSATQSAGVGGDMDITEFSLGAVRNMYSDRFKYDNSAKGFYLAQQYYIVWYYGTMAYDRLDEATLSHSSYLVYKFDSLRKKGKDLSKLKVAEVDKMSLDISSAWYKADTAALGIYGAVSSYGSTKQMGNTAKGKGAVSSSSYKPIQQINNRFPDDVQTGKEFSFNIENGYLKNTNGLNEVDFVVDMNGKLHIGTGHSFLAKGKPVQAAGKLKINGQGQVRSISNLSGHYTPTVAQTKLFPQVLEQAGVKTKNAWLEIYKIQTTSSGYVNTSQLVKVSSTKIKQVRP